MNKSEIVRRLLDKHNGNLTYGQVEAEMQKAGIDAGLFNVTKNKWRAKHGLVQPRGSSKAPKKVVHKTNGVPSSSDLELALSFIREAGGLSKAKEKVAASKSAASSALEEAEKQEKWLEEFAALAS
jgi:geranylgeranyl pyrophosphate synthase